MGRGYENVIPEMTMIARGCIQVSIDGKCLPVMTETALVSSFDNTEYMRRLGIVERCDVHKQPCQSFMQS